jgi:hypothetical protein
VSTPDIPLTLRRDRKRDLHILKKFCQSSCWSSPLDLLGIGGLFEDEGNNQERWVKGDVVLKGPDGPINLPIFLLPLTQKIKDTVDSYQSSRLSFYGELDYPSNISGILDNKR